ncbi:MAG: hypothetical protein RMJ55_20390 [Roseiflexaceae bacterium]|nr:hypothetical protein [Roseiflexaceae bacterium]
MAANVIFSQSGGIGYAGISAGGSAQLQALYPREIHLMAAYAHLLGSCNVFIRSVFFSPAWRIWHIRQTVMVKAIALRSNSVWKQPAVDGMNG